MPPREPVHDPGSGAAHEAGGDDEREGRAERCRDVGEGEGEECCAEEPVGCREEPASEERGEGGDTVGAVALDGAGNLAAGTSTGGLTNKMFGRVGDSPIIGAGNYCDNRYGGAACTGMGELAIRVSTARSCSTASRMASSRASFPAVSSARASASFARERLQASSKRVAQARIPPAGVRG